MIKRIVAKAPANIMIMGEHSVLRNCFAIAGAVNKYITVSLYPTKENKIKIYSALGILEFEISNIENLQDFKNLIAMFINKDINSKKK